MSEIKPCPFCGGSAEIREFDHRHPYEPFGLVVAHSDDCFLYFPRDETAIHAAWDVRPVEDELSVSLNRASDACASVQRERDEAVRIARSLLLVVDGIEAHCRNDAGLKGVDHADDGRRVRHAMNLAAEMARAFLARYEGGR